MLRSFIRSFGVIPAAVFLWSCADSALQGPTSPIDPVSAPAGATSAKTGDVTDALPNSRKVALRALWWNTDWEPQRVVKVTETIGPSGGLIKIPQTGLTMLFPPGAVRAPIKITVGSDDSYVAYKMEPSGTQFLKDVTVTQLLSFTEVGSGPLRKQLFAAYIADDNLKLSGKIRVLEIEPSTTVVSPRTGLPEAQVWLIKHFSRYMLASG
ncbi:MAG: hypothetical protein M3Z18_09000 [Gemmatimonadota bacterium]|nr:hypothetical protein [Gemmatimonadota bacterium]